ncbi:MAG TPA: hypothetical protein VF837_02510 [Patescibacteria group bacterium]
MRKVLAWTLSLAFLVGLIGTPASLVLASGGFTQVAGSAFVYNSIPAPVGQTVNFYCAGTFAGQSTVTTVGVLNTTDIGSANGTLCHEGDEVTAMVGPFRALVTPRLFWANDSVVHQITARAIDTEYTIDIQSASTQLVNLPLAFELPIGLRYEDYNTGKTDTVYFMSSGSGMSFDAKSFEFLSANGMPFSKVYYDRYVCSGIGLKYDKSGQTSLVSVTNNSGQVMQVMLTLDGTTNPAGLLNPGGSFSVESDVPGAVALLKDGVSGSQCVSVGWNLRIQKIFLPFVKK